MWECVCGSVCVWECVCGSVCVGVCVYVGVCVTLTIKDREQVLKSVVFYLE